MRTAIIVLAMLTLTPAVAALPPTIKTPDGITALIAAVNSVGGQIIEHDENGDFVFEISIFEKVDGAWAQVSRAGSFRMAVYGANLVEYDVETIPFVASATAPVTVTTRGDWTFFARPMDIWVTMYRAEEYPTSHYSVQKNALIEAGLYDAADAFDYHHVLNPMSG